VTLTFGSTDLIVHALARSREHLTEILTRQLVGIDGVRHVTSDVVLETVQLRWGLATLPEVREPPLEFPAPAVDMDDFDRSLVACLVADGRRSNREIARQLGVSDGTVRTRIRRLEDAGLMRIVAQTDPVALGVAGSIAHIGIEVIGGSLHAVADELSTWPEVASCTITSGSHDLHVVVAAPDVVSLGMLVAERLRGLPGVRRTTTWPAVDVLKHEYHLVRLLDDKP
jgi:DNA-binding Lrp family transcriptional regulator